MYFILKCRKRFFISLASLIAITLILSTLIFSDIFFKENESSLYAFSENGDTYIKWVEFDVPLELMQAAIEMDIDSYYATDNLRLNWVEMLAVLATKYYGNYSNYKLSDLQSIANDLKNGLTPEEIVGSIKNYPYYLESYTAVLGGFVGEYETEVEKDGEKVWESQYGLKVFSPIAKGYAYNHYDDFGNSRNYGYKRKHLGHDLMVLVGTPIIAVESGIVEIMGWNTYGGWRIGIRSFDGIRYYYYAHLRQNRPFAENLKAGQAVMAGDVIGYAGRTGYSTKENTNGITQTHLHYGLQLIFDDVQKDGTNQIWIDLYDLTRLLERKRSGTVRDSETKEHTRLYGFREEVPQNPFIPDPLVVDDDSQYTQ